MSFRCIFYDLYRHEDVVARSFATPDDAWQYAIRNSLIEYSSIERVEKTREEIESKIEVGDFTVISAGSVQS